MKFYKCEKCGKIAVLFRESQCPTKCCGEAMVEIRVFDSLIFDEIAKTANWRLFLCQI